MARISYADITQLELGKLSAAAEDWKKIVRNLDGLREDARRGMVAKSEKARWAGVNATVTKAFVRKTAKEFDDLHREALSIANVLDHAHTELRNIQRDVEAAARDALKDGLLVTNSKESLVKVIEAQCKPGEEDTKKTEQAKKVEENIKTLLRHAASIDEYARRALRKSHGANTHNAGHANYKSLDKEMIPRAVKLASRGSGLTPDRKTELRQIWDSLSPQSRAELWKDHRDNLVAAGALSPTAEKKSDVGSGKHGVRSPGFGDFLAKDTATTFARWGELGGLTDAAAHMKHYLGNTGDPIDLPVDKMMAKNPDLRQLVRDMVDDNGPKWKKEALAVFDKSDGSPIALPIKTDPEVTYFQKDADKNWFYAVGGASSNVTGVVTVEKDSNGKPNVSLEYQVNVWDRYNWDKDKSVEIGGVKVSDGFLGKMHESGIAKEFDMSGSGSRKRIDLGSLDPVDSGSIPVPESSDKSDGRTELGRDSSYR